MDNNFIDIEKEEEIQKLLKKYGRRHEEEIFGNNIKTNLLIVLLFVFAIIIGCFSSYLVIQIVTNMLFDGIEGKVDWWKGFIPYIFGFTGVACLFFKKKQMIVASGVSIGFIASHIITATNDVMSVYTQSATNAITQSMTICQNTLLISVMIILVMCYLVLLCIILTALLKRIFSAVL